MGEHLTGDLLTGSVDKGPEYGCVRPGGTDDWLLFCTIGGRGLITHRLGTLELGAGDCVLFAPGTPHDYRTEPKVGRWRFLWAHFQPRPHWHDWLRWPQVAKGIGLLRVAEGESHSHLVGLLDASHTRALEGGVRGMALARVHLEEALIRLDLANPSAADGTLDPRVRKALAYCARNLAGRVRLKDVAGDVGLSIYRLAHLVQAQTGASVQEHVERHRLQRAVELLSRTDLRIAEIAEETGFASPFYFSTRFRRTMGMSPRAWRTKHRLW